MSDYHDSLEGGAHHTTTGRADSEDWQGYQSNWRHNDHSAEEHSFAPHEGSVTYSSQHYVIPDQSEGTMFSGRFTLQYAPGYGTAGFLNEDGTYSAHYTSSYPYAADANDGVYGYGFVPASMDVVSNNEYCATGYELASHVPASEPTSPISPTSFNPLASSTLAPLLTHYQTYFSRQTRTQVLNSASSPPASSASASSGSVEEDIETSSETLYQHACAEQRRSRHDPGGGTSQQGKLHTPEEQLSPSPHSNQGTNLGNLPLALPTSSELFGATTEVPSPSGASCTSANCQKGDIQEDLHGKGKTVERYRTPSPMAHLPYPKHAVNDETRHDPTTEAEALQSSTSGVRGSLRSSSSKSGARTEGTSNVKTTIMYSPCTGRKSAVVSGELPEASVKPRRGTPVKIACFFCRRRKIACGGPIGSGEDKTCRQCASRHIECTYPEETHRGKRPKH